MIAAARKTLLLVLALGLGTSVFAVEVRTEPQAVVRGLQLHLDNLRSLAELPAATEVAALKTVPDHGLTQLPLSYIQQAYAREAPLSFEAGEAAGGLIVQAVAQHPALIDRIAPALRKAQPGDEKTEAAIQGLWRFAASMRGKGGDDPAETEAAWQKLEKLFEGRVDLTETALRSRAANEAEFEPRADGLIARGVAVAPRLRQVDAWLASGGSDPVALALGGMDPVLASELLELAHAPLIYQAAAAAWLRTGDADAKARLAARPDILQGLWRERRRHEGALRERHETLPSLVKAYGASPEALKAVLDHTVEREGGYVVEQNPVVWSALDADQRAAAVARLDAASFAAPRAVRLYLELEPGADLPALARRYALGRSPETLQRYLSLRLSAGKGKTVRLPLSNLLPAWMRKALERFEGCTGPNCINAALGVHEDREHRHRYVAGEEMLQILGADFEKVDPAGELQVGDVLVYTGMDKQFRHMAAYVGGGFVFNKAGVSRYNPYVFQHRAVVEAGLVRAGGLRTLVFRRKAAPAAEPAAARGPPLQPAPKVSRFPVRRGEIGWGEFLRLVNPYSPVNTVRAPLKTSSDRALEERKWRQNAGYALGVFPRNFEAQERHDREAAREARLKELGERVRAAYDFPPLDRDSPPVVLGQKLGEGGQGSAYAVEGRPGRAVKVFRGAALAQLEEMAAILNTVADDGAPIERVELARLKGGGWGLEMRDLSRERGWINLATYVRVHPKAAAERKLVSRADKALFALGRETKRVLGFDAADWKAGFAGEISDDYLENFAYNPETGELTCFDGLVRW